MPVAGRWVHVRAADGVTLRRVAAIGPVDQAVLEIEVEIDRLGQTVEQDFDVAAIRGPRGLRYVETGAENPAFAGVVRSLLRPIHVATVMIDGDPDAPFRGVSARTRVAVTSHHERLDRRAVEVGTHDAHAFAIRPVEFSALLVERQLFWCERRALGHDRPPIFSVD